MWRGILGAAGLVAPAAGEVVTQLAHDSLYQYVITDVSVYRGHPAAVPLVSVGQTLGAMTALFDTVQMAELGSGAQGSDAVLPALVADQRLLDTGSPLVFPNQDETWEFVDLDGVPAARFTLLGDAAEIERYWGTLVSTGVRRDIALAQTVGVVGPGSAVPVNPMRFLLGITGANTVAIRLKPEHFLSADQRFLDRVTSLVSPATQLLFQTDVAPAQDALDLGSTSQDAADVYDALAAPLDQVTVGGSPLAHLVLSDLTPLITVT